MQKTVEQLLNDGATEAKSKIDLKIDEMKNKRSELINQKKDIGKYLRLAERKRQRLKVKARVLSSQDLVEVLQFRKKDLNDRNSRKK